MKKKVISILLAALTIGTVLGGCGTANGTAGEGAAAQSADVVNLRFASWDNAEDLDTQQGMVDQFNASHDNIKVTLEAYGDEYDTKISAGMGAGDAPDIMYMWNYPAYYEGLEPLDSYLEGEGAEFKANYYDALWSYNQIDGTVYGMPVGFTTHALYYNKDIFAAAGVAEPTDDWTFDDLQEAARTITEKVPGVKGFSYQIKADPYDFEMYLWSNNTALVNADGQLTGSLNSPESVAVFTMFQEMGKEGYAVPTEENGSDEFRSGQTAMYIYGAWGVSTLEADGMNFGIVNIPAFAGAGKDSVSILSSSGLSISKDSPNKEAAWEFVKYWTGEEMNKARIGYELPALKSVVEAEKVMDNPNSAPFYTMLEQSNGYVPASFIVDDWSELYAALSLGLERMFNPTVTEDPATVLEELVRSRE